MSPLKDRRKYLNLSLLHKLLSNKRGCPQILEKINFKINKKNTINKGFFTVMNYHHNCILHSPANSLMSTSNCVDIDTFKCTSNYNFEPNNV